ncbi:hypothetical protein [Devosia sp.]|uniref:hypothetical protein n=1 Tax=Devosia sp. TaxID=1871048 RepID=UPI003A8F2440
MRDKFHSQARRFFTSLSAMRRVDSAIEAGVSPAEQDLQALGIDRHALATLFAQQKFAAGSVLTPHAGILVADNMNAVAVLDADDGVGAECPQHARREQRV